MKIENAEQLVKQILEREHSSVPAVASKIGVSPQTLYRVLQKKSICWKSQYKLITYHLSKVHQEPTQSNKTDLEVFD